MTPEEAHEASQGAYMQAAWLEQCANNDPDPHKRREYLRRARIALGIADKLRESTGVGFADATQLTDAEISGVRANVSRHEG